MRVLVTNDDGVRAPGIAALARAAMRTGHDVVVVAPMVDYSGSGAAVGPVHSRDGIDYETHHIEGLGDTPVYAIDGPPALAVILACVEGFGPRPDIVLSGINHGANVGRSVLHSGTVGATLTAAHFGLKCLAVSIRYGDEPVPWETPAALAQAAVPVLEEAPPGTVLNLNVPDVALSSLRGVRSASIGRSGTIRSAVQEMQSTESARASAEGSHISLPPFPSGTLRLDLSPPWNSPEADLTTDAGLISMDYAAVTSLVGVREAEDEATDEVVATALASLNKVCDGF